MGSIVIKLNPQKLINPDADIRYLISDKVEELTLGKVTGNGYDYLDDEVSSMVIFFKSSDPKEDIAFVLEILSNNSFKCNQIHGIAEIFLSDKSDKELDAYNYDLSMFEQIR